MVLHAEGEIKLSLSPKVAIQTEKKVTIKATWHIARHKDNRYYSIVWASTEGESGSAFRQMEGEDMAVTYERLIDVTRGVYIFEACVYRLTRRFCDKQSLEVL